METKHCGTGLISELLAAADLIVHRHLYHFFSSWLLYFWIIVHKFQNGPGPLSGL